MNKWISAFIFPIIFMKYKQKFNHIKTVKINLVNYFALCLNRHTIKNHTNSYKTDLEI